MSNAHFRQAQRILDALDAVVDEGPTPANLAPIRTMLVAFRDEPEGQSA